MHVKRTRVPFFRIFYSTSFTVLTLILVAALLITPGDHIYQSFRSGQVFHIFIIGGFYLLTFLVSILTYGGRLYKTRASLAGIPRDGVPKIGGKVGREVQAGLRRSAMIAYESRPRDLRDEKAGRGIEKRSRLGMSSTGRQSQDSVQSFEPVWGPISHPGWSSPSSPDLPNLHYGTVILELSNLIEAKAVSLAPIDPSHDASTTPEADEPPPLDPLTVSLLERPATMGLRDYITHLTTLEMISPASLGTTFLALYEAARFSEVPLTEPEFRNLMAVFAEVLRSMKPIDPATIDSLHAEVEDEISSSSSSISSKVSLATNETVQHTPQPDTWHSASSSASTSSGESTHNTVHTARSRPGVSRNISSVSRLTSGSRMRVVKTPSLSSLRRMRTGTDSTGAGSVIRLAEAAGPLDLPYTIHTGNGK